MIQFSHAIYILVFIIVVTLLLFLFEKVETEADPLQPNEIQLYSLLKELGYSNIKPTIKESRSIRLRDQVIATKRGHQVRFLNLHRDSAGFSAMAAEFDINHRFQLTIKRRGFFEVLLGLQKGKMSYIDKNLMIETTHPYFIKTIYNHPPHQKLLIRLLKTVDTIKFRNSSHQTVAINNPQQMLEISELMIEFVELIQQFVSHGVPQAIEVEPISYEDLKIISPTCVICFSRIGKNTDFFYFECCQSVTHPKHGRNWLTERNLCPYCKIKQPEVIRRET